MCTEYLQSLCSTIQALCCTIQTQKSSPHLPPAFNSWYTHRWYWHSGSVSILPEGGDIFLWFIQSKLSRTISWYTHRDIRMIFVLWVCFYSPRREDIFLWFNSSKVNWPEQSGEGFLKIKNWVSQRGGVALLQAECRSFRPAPPGWSPGSGSSSPLHLSWLQPEQKYTVLWRIALPTYLYLMSYICTSSLQYAKVGGPQISYANPQIHNFAPDKHKLKIFSFKFKDDFWLLGQFRDRVTWHFPV